MKTSRIAKETAKIVDKVPHTEAIGRRQTRSFATSLQAFSADATTTRQTRDLTVKQEDDSEDSDSPLSSATSFVAFDIEDFAKSITSPSLKRKRQVGSHSLTSISTPPITQSLPQNEALEIKDSDGKFTKARRQLAKKTTNEVGKVEIYPPADWAQIYDAVKEMRKTVLAPVDTMGCERLAEEHVSEKDKRFQTLIALMLSSQTKDTTNALAMRRLQTELPPPGLTLENILAVDPVQLNKLIYAVGFHNNKTKYIKAAALILRDQFGGDIPDTIEGLTSLPGVGPKMGYLCLSAAWGRTEGIGVDVHVHRITNLWKWHKTKTPEETRKALQGWLPRDKWHEINHLLVGFGQTICTPVGRDCGNCTLSSKRLCPSAVVARKKQVVGKSG
ncbi:DNA N-glycosylase and apurinic/apyrimidinic (AP) lyase [Peltigera leucophlebia]|nr:DNA N-glycosylase and apurinic/apyrimidinic (AP) lyase [Peltigera leucophlebia]